VEPGKTKRLCQFKRIRWGKKEGKKKESSGWGGNGGEWESAESLADNLLQGRLITKAGGVGTLPLSLRKGNRVEERERVNEKVLGRTFKTKRKGIETAGRRRTTEPEGVSFIKFWRKKRWDGDQRA